MKTIRDQYWNFGFFHNGFFKNTKNAPILTIFVACGWLTNLSLNFGLLKSMPKLNSIR